MSQSHRWSPLGPKVAVDLGTANTVIYVPGHGIVLDEPSMVTVAKNTGRLLAVGSEARRMLGRTPTRLEVLRPLKDGVIADLDVADKMLQAFIRRACGRRWVKPQMAVAVPSAVTPLGRRAVQEAAEFAGARKPVRIIEEPMAAAIGAGLPIEQPTANAVVDIGGGTTEVAVIALGGVVASRSVQVAGDEIDEAIVAFCRKEYGLVIGDRTAERLKTSWTSAWPLVEERYVDILGASAATGFPTRAVVSTGELRDAIEEPLLVICDAVKSTFEGCPPELVADLMDRGIALTGGGALLLGIDVRLSDELGVPARVARDPLHSVAVGAGRFLETI